MVDVVKVRTLTHTIYRGKNAQKVGRISCLDPVACLPSVISAFMAETQKCRVHKTSSKITEEMQTEKHTHLPCRRAGCIYP